MKHDFLDHHRSGNSIVHQADPRLKLLMMIGYILLVVAIPFEFKKFYLILALVPILLAVLSKVSVFHFLSKLAKIYPMIFLITFLLPFFPVENSQVYQISFFKIYEHGLQKFLLINIKSVLAIFMSIILTTTTDFSVLLKGMEKLKIPKIIIVVLSFMYRFIFLLIDETERMQMAYKSRYIRLAYFTKLKFIARQIGVLFIRTYERGEQVYQAMDARGFNGDIYILNELKWKGRDNLLLTIFLLILILPFILI